MDKRFTMRPARIADTEQVLALLIATAKWFKQKGSTQWAGLLEGIDTHQTDEAIVRGDVFICQEGEVIAGMVMLLRQPSVWDQTLWQLKEGEANDAIYLHRLAINRDYANNGLGTRIVTWCKNNIQFTGKTKIRLDCVADNAFLNAFYKNVGFTYVGEKDGYSLYEVAV